MTNRRHGMGDDRAHYREQTWAPLWVMALMWGAFLVAIIRTGSAVFRAGSPADGQFSSEIAPVVAILGLVFLLLLAVNAVFTRLDVEVLDDHILIAFGPVHLVRKHIHFSEIEAVRSLTYRPLIEFGGWGIKWRPGRTAWTIRGCQAVAVTLKSGRQIYVGSEHPQRLAGAIQAAMRTPGAAE